MAIQLTKEVVLKVVEGEGSGSYVRERDVVLVRVDLADRANLGNPDDWGHYRGEKKPPSLTLASVLHSNPVAQKGTKRTVGDLCKGTGVTFYME